MDFHKTKIYLDKINREFNRMSKDPESVARIDVDIMLSYVREVYDALLSDAAPAPPLREPVSKKTGTAKAPEPSEPEAPAPAAPAPPPPPPIVVRETPPPPPPPPAPPVAETPPPAPPAPPADEPAPTPVTPPKPAASPSVPPEAESLFEEKQAKELSEKLSEMPIADLRRAIALNDRLLLTRELFSGDGTAFEATINALNSFSHFDDARMYMLENCVVRFGWLDKKRIDAAKTFIKLVRRRYK